VRKKSGTNRDTADSLQPEKKSASVHGNIPCDRASAEDCGPRMK